MKFIVIVSYLKCIWYLTDMRMIRTPDAFGGGTSGYMRRFSHDEMAIRVVWMVNEEHG